MDFDTSDLILLLQGLFVLQSSKNVPDNLKSDAKKLEDKIKLSLN